MNHYTYYSYEEWGRGYIGSRSCACLPEEDVDYFGSFEDKTFNPRHKVILTVTPTRPLAIQDEVIFHEFFQVDINPHFANQVKQTSTKFHRSGPHTEATRQKMRRNRKGKGTGPSPHPYEHFQALGQKGGKLGGKNQSIKDKQKGGRRCRDEKLGFFALTPEENLKKAQRGAETTNKQLWMCTVTGKVSTPGGLTRWQQARNIDIKNRKRVYPD